MASISSSGILSVFTLIRDAILANTTLAAKFRTEMIHQFEPHHKSNSFKGFPYFWVAVPSADQKKVVFNNGIVSEELSVSVFLRMDWEAKDNAVNYANAFLEAISDYESKFQAAGYYDVMVSLIDVNPNQQIEQKQVVESEFLLTFKGHVRRG